MSHSVRSLSNDCWREKLQDFFSSHQEICCLPASNLEHCKSLAFHGAYYEGQYYGLLNGEDDLIGIVIHYWNGNLFVLWPENQTDALRSTISNALQQRPIFRVEGSGAAVKQVESMKIMPNAKLSVKTILSLDLNAITCESLDQAFQLQLEFTNDEMAVLSGRRLEFLMESYGLGQPTDELWMRANQTISELANQGTLRVLRQRESGEMLAMLAYNGMSKSSVMIGNLFVTRALRRLGYARQLMLRCLHELTGIGVRIICLYTGNHAAEALYLSLGFKIVDQPYAVLHNIQ